jgi:hypothetical protein
LLIASGVFNLGSKTQWKFYNGNQVGKKEIPGGLESKKTILNPPDINFGW